MNLITINLHPARRGGPSSARVTPRQAEVIEFRRRLSVQDTAAVMGVSPNTVKTLQARGIEALGAETLADAVVLLAERRAA